MTPDQFCYWLQGFFELTQDVKLSQRQAYVIKEHLQLVFEKVTSRESGEHLEQSEYVLTPTCSLGEPEPVKLHERHTESFENDVETTLNRYYNIKPSTRYCSPPMCILTICEDS